MGIWKSMFLASGEIPTMEELEMLKDARERAALVIRARWILLGILAVYGLALIVFYQHASADVGRITPVHGIVAILAFATVAAYNAWYLYSYHWFSRIRSIHAVQLLIDLVFITLVVHYSGGAVSWFWSMYMVLTLEAALIMEKRSDTYAIALAGALAYGGLLTFEYYGILSPVPMPFENNALQGSFSYAMIKWAWVSITNFCVAFVGAFLMDTVRRREARLRDLVVKDPLTGLYNRRFFFYRLNSEIMRAKRYGRPLSLLLLDVDDFKALNDLHGHLAGDKMLQELARKISGMIRRSDSKPPYEVDIACRYGGEEFAIVLPEAMSSQGPSIPGREPGGGELKGAVVVAERIRRRIEESRFRGLGMTVSIGVCSYPDHGTDFEALIRAADDALYEAKKSGKNRVVVAGEAVAAPGTGDRHG
jgi:GGDEF domain-containing protein